MDNAEPTGTEKEVCRDIAKRQAVGVLKYGQTVSANPLPLHAWLRHAYEESLDLPIYLRRAMNEQAELIAKWEARIAETETCPDDGVKGRRESLMACATIMREFIRDLKGI